MREPSYARHLTTASSRFFATNTRTDDSVRPGTKRLETWVFPDIGKVNYTTHMIDSSDVGRLDRLAYEFWGDPTLWWLLAWFNNIKNPLEDMSAGQIIKVPELSEVNAKVAEQLKRKGE